MNLVPGVQRVTSDVVVGTGKNPVRLFCVCLVSGTSTASTLQLRNGVDVSSNPNEQVDGITNQSVLKNYAGGLRFPSGLYADVDGNINYATISFSEEF